jgi:mono/diheme cytochrome c family protein
MVCAVLAAACSHGTPPVERPVAPKVPRAAGVADAPKRAIERLPHAREGAAVMLAKREGRVVAYVADEDDAMVRVVDVDDGREIAHVRPGGIPAQLVMLPDGRVVASLRDVSQLAIIDGDGVTQRVDVPTEPIGLALSPDDATLVVASGWGRAVSVLDARTFAKRASYPVGREPRGVVVDSSGKRAFVSHAVGQRIDVVAIDGIGPPRALDASGSEESVGRHMFLASTPRAACQGFALAKSDGGRIFAPQALVFTGDTSSPSEGYGGGGDLREPEVFHVPVIDEDAAAVVAESANMRAGASHETRCALPRAAAVGKAGLFVTCLGDDAVALYDAAMIHPDDVELARWKVPSGPIGIALDEDRSRAIVWSQFAHALTTIAVNGEGQKPFALASTTLAREIRTSAKVERGRALFHATGDSRISGDGRACASCHPEGRDDTLVWSSPNGPRQTPMLAGRLDGAAPYGWNGDAKDVSTHLVSTFKRLGGKGVTGEDKEALMAYVASMRPPPSAKAKDDAAKVARGAAIFRSSAAGCSGCHGEDGDLPDGAAHDVKSMAEGDQRKKFDTPSLKNVGGTGPWFHDGRYADLKTLIVRSDGKMGHTKQLSEQDVADLASYLESL